MERGAGRSLSGRSIARRAETCEVAGHDQRADARETQRVKASRATCGAKKI
jgi:hypothetical protein